jgi:transposase
MNAQEPSIDELRATPKVRLNSPDRAQVDPYPKTIDELVGPDDVVRVIWESTGKMDFSALHSQFKSVVGHPGPPVTDRRILACLWIYAATNGATSAHVLAELCRKSDPYKWICGGVDMNYHTLSDFRVDNAAWLEEQVVQQITGMRLAGFVPLKNLGQDGVKVRANAGKGSFHSKEVLQRCLKEAKEEWARLQQEFEAEQPVTGAAVRAARERLERTTQALDEVAKVAQKREKREKGKGKTARASTTDPEAHNMKMPNGGYDPAYNVQLVTDLDSFVILAFDVLTVGSDLGQLNPMLEKLEQQQSVSLQDVNIFADGNFAKHTDIDEVAARGAEVYTPVKQAAQQIKAGKDPYAPKAGDTPNVAEWRQRMGTDEAKEMYKQRSKTELPNAQLRIHGLYQFLVRTLLKVRAVVMWYVLAQNLTTERRLRAQLA